MCLRSIRKHSRVVLDDLLYVLKDEILYFWFKIQSFTSYNKIRLRITKIQRIFVKCKKSTNNDILDCESSFYIHVKTRNFLFVSNYHQLLWKSISRKLLTTIKSYLKAPICRCIVYWPCGLCVWALFWLWGTTNHL